jgi:hypothetical protein
VASEAADKNTCGGQILHDDSEYGIFSSLGCGFAGTLLVVVGTAARNNFNDAHGTFSTRGHRFSWTLGLPTNSSEYGSAVLGVFQYFHRKVVTY